MINTTEFIARLREIAQELKPLTQSALPGAATWDGTSYVKGARKTPDPYALAWWSALGTIADLIEAQASPLTPGQVAYLNRVLFAGMGSLNDLRFDPESLGDAADAINRRLDQKRRALFASFSD